MTALVAELSGVDRAHQRATAGSLADAFQRHVAGAGRPTRRSGRAAAPRRAGRWRRLVREGWTRVGALAAAAPIRRSSPAQSKGSRSILPCQPSCSLPGRHARIRSLHDPQSQIFAQYPSQHPPRSPWMLNHQRRLMSHHNRFIDRRTCSSTRCIVEPDSPRSAESSVSVTAS